MGECGLKVSRLCFGSLTMGPLQANMSVENGASLICRAVAKGVNFIDTAEIYGNYEHIGRALAKLASDDLPGCRKFKDITPDEVVVATKTYAYTREQAARSLEKARREMNRDRIDIFMLHEQESRLTLEGHLPALEYFQEARREGKVGAVGISCHTTAAVKAALEFSQIQVIHPLFNLEGIGIRDGTREEMEAAIEDAHHKGVGVYIMKPLGGGHLQEKVDEAINYARCLPFIDAIALGMRSVAEVDYALCLFRDEEVPISIRRQTKQQRRHLHYSGEDCLECLCCIEACPQGALSWQGKPVVDEEKCLWCGYCGAACPCLCLRII